ncbi:MAG: COX15/CtaA family protein [Thermoanaerobaculia bacterium]|nr:COX15/CtaA family protein [Thermoanaerobaculia bacterium]
MILLGGFTRLTHSGLSIVEWKPVTGTIPPLSESAWEDAFAQYREFPEYSRINQGMSLAEFQRIYWVEYAHRLLGRLSGFLFFLPLLYFWIKGRVTRRLKPQLMAILILGGLQGFLGWYMVRSGLIDRPQVSQYRLTAHLGLAVLLYGYLVWLALGLLRSGAPDSPFIPVTPLLRRLSYFFTGGVFLMILSGGLVAGTRAGFIANTFPLMHGFVVPPGLYGTDPPWRAAFEDLLTVQFNHRLLALFLAVLVISLVALGAGQRTDHRLRIRIAGVLTAFLVQASLGIGTLVMAVPLVLGVAHQAGSIVLLTAALWLSRDLISRRPHRAPGPYRLSPTRTKQG